MDVMIGFLMAWRGIPAAAAGPLMAAKQIADAAVLVAETATKAAAGTPGAPVAFAAEQTLKTTIAATLGSAISAMGGMGADIHMCTTPAPLPPHGPGVVIDGSPTVMINMLPACRQGDTIIEPLGPPNKIAMGWPTVIIGQMGSGSGFGPGQGAGGAAGANTAGTGQTLINEAPDSGTGSGRRPGGAGIAGAALMRASRSAAAVVDCGPG